MEDISDTILDESCGPVRLLGTSADCISSMANISYQVSEVHYPTTDQVYFDQQISSASLGLLPDFYDCDDVLPPLLEPEQISFSPQFDAQAINRIDEQPQEQSTSSNIIDETDKRRRSQAKTFTCAHCKKHFTKNFDFCQHLRSHTGEKPFICIICGLAFTQKCNVKKHLLTHMVWNPHRIPEETFTTTGHLPRETLRGNIMDKGFECRFCSTNSFPTYADFRTHLKTHMSEKVFRCILPSCEQTPGSVEHLLVHVKAHEVSKEYRCTTCEATFHNLYQFSFHNFAHSQTEALSGQRPSRRTTQRFQYKCEICQERFSEPEDLKEHRETEGHLYKCPHCNSKFSQERYLRRHLVVHEAETGYLCDQCGKGFKLKHHLASHNLTHNEKAFSCPKCSRAFARPDQVIRHVKAVHEPRAFQCGACLKTFSRKDKLREHTMYKRTRCLPLQGAVQTRDD